MGMLTDHARRELELVGQFEEDPQFAQSLLAAVASFESYGGHSGSSAAVGINMLCDLLAMRNLSPLTNNPEEWMRHTPDMWDGEHHVWQNKRNGSAFSIDGGLTYTLLEEDKRKQPHRTMITHTMEGQPITLVKQEPVMGEAPMEPVNTSNEEPVRDAVVGYRCTCGEIHLADSDIWQEFGHYNESNEADRG